MKAFTNNDRPIILLHGWTMRGAIFDSVSEQLGPRCIAPDLPGHGTAASSDVGIDACVEALTTLIDSTGRDDVLLVGWSMGALVAWSYIGKHGTSRLAGLVTVDMSPRPTNSDGWSLGLCEQTKDRQKRATEEIHRDWPTAAVKIASTMFASRDGAPKFSREAALDQVMSNDPKIMAQYWNEMMTADLRNVVPKVDIPWLVAFGAGSRVYPAQTAAWLEQNALKVRRVEFQASGHSPHLEEPERFVQVLSQFEETL